MKFKIGIPCWSLGENAFGVTKNYIAYAQRFGKVIPLLPSDEIDQTLDLIILPGGLDVNPNMYGAVPSVHTTSTDVFKQYFVDETLVKYIKAGIGIFGICLGFQQIAAYFNIPLVQDLMFHPQSDDRWKAGHKVTVTVHGRDYQHAEDRRKNIEVNSHHHQAVILSDLREYGGDAFNVLAIADHPTIEKESIVEAFYHKKLPIAGVQFHAEELGFDPGSQWFADTILRRVLLDSRMKRGLEVEDEVNADTNE
jgi:putative glutamine amidotransferase